MNKSIKNFLWGMALTLGVTSGVNAQSIGTMSSKADSTSVNPLKTEMRAVKNGNVFGYHTKDLSKITRSDPGALTLDSATLAKIFGSNLKSAYFLKGDIMVANFLPDTLKKGTDQGMVKHLSTMVQLNADGTPRKTIFAHDTYTMNGIPQLYVDKTPYSKFNDGKVLHAFVLPDGRHTGSVMALDESGFALMPVVSQEIAKNLKNQEISEVVRLVNLQIGPESFQHSRNSMDSNINGILAENKIEIAGRSAPTTPSNPVALKNNK